MNAEDFDALGKAWSVKGVVPVVVEQFVWRDVIGCFANVALARMNEFVGSKCFVQ